MATRANRAKKPTALKTAVQEYMNESHLEEFKASLLQMRQKCLMDIENANEGGNEELSPAPDNADRSDQRMEIENRARNIERLVNLKREIEAALRRIEGGEFGYCEESGDEIGLDRLRANPLARYSFEAQSRLEHLGKLRAAA
ncbi:TraR/DksA family transcriptional regulator [Thiobacillus denitrificans]|uniref:TraR/DksA family transcriptional regulator n=1 Tax=Thiobacillus denitrificans TaxID=36861 RepID=UPI0003670E0E|nr:TraR/DksA C4-type zinc finger protein [Thiobacillus denitrificans]